MQTVLVSVSDKTRLSEFIACLKKFDELKLIATSSTAKFLKENKYDCQTIDEVTKFPEILGGRVKTLHPNVFAGILARPTDEDLRSLKDLSISAIDMVICNLYPFEKKLKENLSEAEMVEHIDIGGVTLIRAAAKNFARVAIVCDPSQYEKVIQAMESNGGRLPVEDRKGLAHAALKRTASYDRQISDYFCRQLSGNGKQLSFDVVEEGGASAQEALPSALNLKLAQYQSLRYGENPHQAAVWYSDGRFGSDFLEFPPFEQLQGKELSSNNVTDTYCLVRILRDIGTPAVCIIKHNNPCGVAVGKTIEEAYEKAYSTDPVSAFGGIYGFTEEVTEELANKINEGFVEIVVAPSFTKGALEAFKTKKNLRVLKIRPTLLQPASETSWHIRDLQDFGYIIEKDVEPPVQLAQFQCVSGTNADSEHIGDVAFAWSVVKHLTSNAIFIAKDGKSLGFGIGQTSRIASVKIALEQAGGEARGAVLASDAFFPAIDNIEAAADAGIKVIVQPGGSVKDKDVIAACQKAGIIMLFTGQRCFKH